MKCADVHLETPHGHCTKLQTSRCDRVTDKLTADACSICKYVDAKRRELLNIFDILYHLLRRGRQAISGPTKRPTRPTSLINLLSIFARNKPIFLWHACEIPYLVAVRMSLVIYESFAEHSQVEKYIKRRKKLRAHNYTMLDFYSILMNMSYLNIHFSVQLFCMSITLC